MGHENVIQGYKAYFQESVLVLYEKKIGLDKKADQTEQDYDNRHSEIVARGWQVLGMLCDGMNSGTS